MSERLVDTPNEIIVRENAAKFGTKYAVQKLFYDLGMCGIDTRLYTPQTPIDVIASEISQMSSNQGFIVRFSYKDALNLPRGFFKDVDQCIEFVDSERKDYAVIIQEYTQLLNSFEYYSDGNLIYLQVLPGMWEVDSIEAPDIVQEKNGELTLWRYMKQRTVKFVDNDNNFYTKEQEPFSVMQLQEFLKRLEPYKRRLETVRNIFSPVFCHFYEDHQGRFCFINVRNVGEVPINDDSPVLFHTIKTTRDVEKWDGNKPILFNVPGQRGDDASLNEAIRLLTTQGVKEVFVNFGILSHPAILLREAGIRVFQAYALYEKVKL